MKKLNLKSQLFLLFSCSLLLATIVFSIVTITFTVSIAKNELYSRLSSYTFIMDSMKDENSPDAKNFPDMEVGYYIYKNGGTPTTSNLESFGVSVDDVISLVDSLKESNKFPHARIEGETEINSKTIYYVCQERGDFSDYVIILTDNGYVNSMVYSISLRIIIAFLILVFIEIVILSLWTNRYVNRIRKLQYHILELPNNKYEKQYIDNYGDEIGELSNSIEKMRLELNTSENTKQEMLQNLSHDFKTPIAVIKSYAEAIQDGIEDQNALNIIIEQADLLKEKVIKLLQYNSLEYLDHNKPFEKINMKSLIEASIIKYKHQKDIDFILDLEDNIEFNGYQENWDIVISNILENALRYAEKEIKIILREKRIRIYNDGEHISEQFIQNSFKPYEKGSKGQFGLGMSIVVKTCNFFGYKLSVRNEEKGVSFIIDDNTRKEIE